MAISQVEVKNTTSASKLPSGYSRPTITEVTGDDLAVTQLTLTVLKATVENSDPAVTMANIINDVTIGVQKQLQDIIAGDYLATATVTSHADLKDVINSNVPSNDASSTWLTDAVINYVCTVELFVKSV